MTALDMLKKIVVEQSADNWISSLKARVLLEGLQVYHVKLRGAAHPHNLKESDKTMNAIADALMPEKITIYDEYVNPSRTMIFVSFKTDGFSVLEVKMSELAKTMEIRAIGTDPEALVKFQADMSGQGV